MKVTPEALKTITDRTLSEVAQRSILAARARQPFNLLLAGHAARSKVSAAVMLVELDAVTRRPLGRFTVLKSDFQYNPNPDYYLVTLRGVQCPRPFCDLGVHCSCADHVQRGGRCKHSLAVELFQLSGGVK